MASFVGCDSPAASNGDVPTVSDTEFLVGLAVDPVNAANSTSFAATSTAGIDLALTVTPAYFADEVNVHWVKSGTICDQVRAISSAISARP